MGYIVTEKLGVCQGVGVHSEVEETVARAIEDLRKINLLVC